MGARRYELAGGNAADVLREFARAAELQLLFPERALRGVRLPPLHGEFSVREALDRLLADSGLEAVREGGTGAYAVRPGLRAAATQEWPDCQLSGLNLYG